MVEVAYIKSRLTKITSRQREVIQKAVKSILGDKSAVVIRTKNGQSKPSKSTTVKKPVAVKQMSSGQLKEAKAHASRLQKSTTEKDFRDAFARLATDKSAGVESVKKVAERLGIKSKLPTRKAALKAIEQHYYEKQYEKDADAMAKRATPW
jgi:predicted lipid-binding transport protein (Tim44 family)